MWHKTILIVAVLTVGSQCDNTRSHRDTICIGKADNTFVRSETSCHNYLVCSGGKVVHEATCVKGLGFNPVKQTCGPVSDAACTESYAVESDSVESAESEEVVEQQVKPTEKPIVQTLADRICLGVADDYFMPSPRSCRHYFVCEDEKGHEDVCPEGYAFNEEEQACDPEDQVHCPVLCPMIGQSVHADEKRCNYFYECRDGKRYQGACPIGHRFNRTTSRCAPRHEVQCANEELCSLGNSTEDSFMMPDWNNCQK